MVTQTMMFSSETLQEIPDADTASAECSEVPVLVDGELRYRGFFWSRLVWGVTARDGTWLKRGMYKHDALRYFKAHPAAYQLIEGCDVHAHATGHPETLFVRQTNPDAADPSTVEEYFVLTS